MEAIDALTEAFAISQVTNQENSTAAPNPRFAKLYKKKSVISHEERRKRFLEAQKQKRYDYANHARKLAFNSWSDDDEEIEDDMDCDEEYFKKPSRSYKNQLMLSEWLVDVPVDLHTEWLLVLCPIGKRCLVISTKGHTKAYSRTGYFMNDFQSELPCGAFKKKNSSLHKYTILDCVYSELTKTYYVLDIMCWNSHPCYDSEAEFRFYWKQEKLKELADVQIVSKTNSYKFINLPHSACDAESIHHVLHSPLPFETKLDGLLFFHKRSHYICRPSPLVTWLKPYMVPEMLNVEIPTYLDVDKPDDYVNMEKLLPKAFEKSLQRKKRDEQNMQYEDD